MSNRWKTLIKYAVCIAVGLAVGVAYLFGYDFAAQTLLHKYRLLSDAFFLPGILMVLFGALIWVSNEGALDGVSFVVSKAFMWLLPGGHLHQGERYSEYVERKRGKRVTGYGFMFWVGLAFLAVGFVFMMLFQNIHG